MPKMAQRMEHTCIIRSLNTKNGDHGGGARLMMRGRTDDPSLRYPDLGAVLARELGRADSPVPDYVSFYSATEGRDIAPGAAGFLGSRYAPMELTTSMIPENIRRPDAHHRPRPPAAGRAARAAEQAVRPRPAVDRRSAATTRPISASAA